LDSICYVNFILKAAAGHAIAWRRSDFERKARLERKVASSLQFKH